MTFGDQVKSARLQLHLSQSDFAKLMGVSFSTVNRWENEKTKPSYQALRTFEALCEKKHILLRAL